MVGFDLRLCVGLSHTVVAVGALGAVLYGLLQPSPSNPRTTLLNFDLAMVWLTEIKQSVAAAHQPDHISFAQLVCRICRAERPLFMQVLVPSMLFGISFGVVLCPLSPEWLQTTLLSVLLVAVTHRTCSQGVNKWRQEQLARECAADILLIDFPLSCRLFKPSCALAGRYTVAARHARPDKCA